MPTLLATGQIFSDADKEIPNHPVRVEMFILGTSRWTTIGSARTDAKGKFKISVDTGRIGADKMVPALRLAESGSPIRVLSTGPILSSSRTTGNITADFGQIERLDDEAFPRLNSSGRNSDQVAGLARKQGLNQGIVLHNLTVNRDIGTMVAAERFRSDSASTSVIATDRGATATTAIANIAANNKLTAEIVALRRVNVEHEAALTSKDRLISAREHDLTLSRDENTRLKADFSATSARLTAEVEEQRQRAVKAESALAEKKLAEKGEETEIDSVFANIGTQLGKADLTMKSRKVPYRLGGIKVDLKGAMRGDGKIFLGGDNPDGSGVSVEMKPESTEESTLPQVIVPDVSGLTQSAAQRVLRSVGLKINTATQPMPEGRAINGQCLRQSPAAGEKTAHGEAVLVVFASVETK